MLNQIRGASTISAAIQFFSKTNGGLYTSFKNGLKYRFLFKTVDKSVDYVHKGQNIWLKIVIACPLKFHVKCTQVGPA